MTEIETIKIWKIKEKVEDVEEAFQEDLSVHEIFRRGEKLVDLLDNTEIKETKYSEFKEYVENIQDYDGFEGQRTFARFLDRLENSIESAPVVKLNYNGEFDPEVFRQPLDKFDNLNRIAEKDIEVGSKCMLNGLYTAAGFMFLRSLEDMTRELLKEETEEEIEQSWGTAMRNLSSHYEQLGNQERHEENLDGLYSALNSLKNLRNDIAHPNKILTRQEAERIFFRVRNASEEISDRLDSLN